MENVASMRSGYSSRSFDRSSEPRPAPVPPPNEWMIWNPCNASHDSVCLRTVSYGENQHLILHSKDKEGDAR